MTHEPLEGDAGAGHAAARLHGGRARSRGTVTARQRQVLTLVARGHTNQAVADALGLSVRTVEMHRRQGMHGIAARSVADVVRWAQNEGLFPS